jgi:MerR family transcriptional regulator, light-induced transcriptional regulator
MASVFGTGGLRSRLADWRVSMKNRAQLFPSLANVQPLFRKTRHTRHDEDLSRLVENLVIPRLVANLNDPADGGFAQTTVSVTDAIARPAAAISEADIREFAELSVRDKPEAMLDFVDQRLAMGCSVENIYIELLAPAARALGSNWEDDSQDFVDVTMGLWRIQEILRELSARVPPKTRVAGFRNSALFSAMPGDQHSFGTLMVSECFERAGWAVDTLIEPSQHALNVQCAEQFYDLVGLTVTADCTSGTLRSIVSTIKSISRNPEVRIMLGGRFINDHPELLAASGADATASDALSAVAEANRMAGVRAEAADR